MNDCERWLSAWHDARPGATSRAFLRGKPSSYEWLASAVRPGERALDLACGDGALLALLAGRGVSGAVGLDMSEGELRAARARLGTEARLLQGRAQALPFPDGSFDVVTCHLALMLMDPVEEAIAEARRVLAPGGRFAAVVSDREGSGHEDAWAVVVRHSKALSFSGPRLGDPRALDAAGLCELLAGFAEVRTEKVVVDLSGTLDEIGALFHETYNATRLAPAPLQALEEALRTEWQAMVRDDGTIPCRMGLLGVVARR
ncbi:MAG: class I SAM-dependent methyltransferase [Minicystis sp.]